MSEQLTEKQALFSKLMFTPGSDTFGNGTESARQAGYKGTDTYLAMTASVNIRKDKIIAEKAKIQGELNQKMSLTAEEVITNLRLAVSIATAKLDASGITAASSWLGKAVPNLFTDNVLTKSKVPDVVPEEEREAITEACKVLKLRLSNGS